MFISFFLKEGEHIFLGTLNVNNLVMVNFEKDEIGLTDDTVEYYYSLYLQFKDIGQYQLFETNDLERLLILHSCFCSVLAGGDTIHPFDDESYIVSHDPFPTEVEPKPSKRRTLSD